MRKLVLSLALMCSSLAAPVAAQERDAPVVVELFTSQGCSSCPPADALLAELAGQEDVIPLALHVDYWDYIGWKDKFAKPAFTKRQKGYARTGGWEHVYTPQIVVNGSEDAVGSRPMKVADLIRRHADRVPVAELTLERQGDTLVIRGKALAGAKRCDIHLIRYEPRASVRIERGENAGRTLDYSHIVRQWDVIGEWSGRGSFEVKATVSGDAPIVVLLQEPRYGPVLAAARLR